MNAYLARLGIRSDIQDWVKDYCHTDERGHLCFAYGDDTEVYGLAFHRVPLTDSCWTVGPENPVLVRQVIICSSAMEAISWLNCHIASVNLDHSFFVATGSRFSPEKFKTLPRGRYVLVFDNDLLGRICDLKVAAVLAGQPLEVMVTVDTVHINFRFQRFSFPAETFSLNAFQRASGYRFPVKIAKPARYSSWLNQLLNNTP